MQDDETENDDSAARDERLRSYELLKDELRELQQKERELLLERSEAKSAYRAKHPGSVAFAADMRQKSLRELLIKDSFSQIEYVMQAATFPVCKVGEGERIVAANQSFLDYLEYTMEDLLSGRITLPLITPPESLELERGKRAEFEDSFVTSAFESERLTSRGERKPVASSLRITSTSPLEYLHFWMDLSDLKYLEDSLKERNAIFSAIVEEMPHIVFVANKKAQMRQFNERFYELSGISSSSDEGDSLSNLLHPLDREPFRRAWSRTVDDGAPFVGEFRLRAQDDEFYWHTFRLMPLAAANGLLDLTLPNAMDDAVWDGFKDRDATLWIGTATDIDRRKRIMDDVLESAQAFQALANQIPQIVWTAAPDGKIDFFNERWYEFSGHDREQRVGLDFALFIHPDDRKQYLNQWKSSVRTGDAFEVDFRLREFIRRSSRLQANSDLEYTRFLARAVALRNYRGEIAQWIGTWTSI